jgi:hypothetical protein
MTRGRPPLTIDLDRAAELLAGRVSLTKTAAALGCSRRTLCRMLATRYRADDLASPEAGAKFKFGGRGV